MLKNANYGKEKHTRTQKKKKNNIIKNSLLAIKNVKQIPSHNVLMLIMELTNFLL